MTVGGENCSIIVVSGIWIDYVPPEEEPQETHIIVSIVSVLQTKFTFDKVGVIATGNN